MTLPSAWNCEHCSAIWSITCSVYDTSFHTLMFLQPNAAVSGKFRVYMIHQESNKRWVFSFILLIITLVNNCFSFISGCLGSLIVMLQLIIVSYISLTDLHTVRILKEEQNQICWSQFVQLVLVIFYFIFNISLSV